MLLTSDEMTEMAKTITTAQAAMLAGRSIAWISDAIQRWQVNHDDPRGLPAVPDFAEGGRTPRPSAHAGGRRVGPSRWAIEVTHVLTLPGAKIDQAYLAALRAEEQAAEQKVQAASSATALATLVGLQASIVEMQRQIDELYRLLQEHSHAGALPRRRIPAADQAPEGSVLVGAGMDGETARAASSRRTVRHPAASDDVARATIEIRRAAGAAGQAPRSDGVKPQRPAATIPLSAPLPPGLVGAHHFALVHGLPPATLRSAVVDGRVPGVRSRWKMGRHYVNWALDASGRAAVYRNWGGTPDFRRCPECPHLDHLDGLDSLDH